MYANMLSQLIEEKEEGLGKLLRSSDQQDVNETFVSLLKALGKKNNVIFDIFGVLVYQYEGGYENKVDNFIPLVCLNASKTCTMSEELIDHEKNMTIRKKNEISSTDDSKKKICIPPNVLVNSIIVYQFCVNIFYYGCLGVQHFSRTR